MLKGIEIVAKRHNLKFNDISFDGTPVNLAGEKLYMHMESMKEGYDPFKSFKEMVENAHDDGCDLLVCHPGYLDAQILRTYLSLLIVQKKQRCYVQKNSKPILKNMIYTYIHMMK